MTRFEYDDGLRDPVRDWDADETDRAYEHWLDEKLGTTP